MHENAYQKFQKHKVGISKEQYADTITEKGEQTKWQSTRRESGTNIMTDRSDT